MPLGFEDN